MASSDKDQEHATRLAGAKLLGGLRTLDADELAVEDGSVYGAAMLNAQIARSLHWPREFTALFISSHIYLGFCMVLHMMLLVYIDKERHVLNKFSGQMYLCDFGAHMDECQGTNACRGPGGTLMKPPRLYNWDQWATRNFVRDSLKTILPHEADNVDDKVDPGEYGVESYECRLLCCLVFVTAIIPELRLCLQMGKLIWLVPWRNEPWVVVNGDKEDVDNWLDTIKIKVAGMNWFWKLWNVLLLFLPKTILTLCTAKAGISFLMETAGVDDIIVNSVALSFLLGLDELIYSGLISAESRQLLQMCEPKSTRTTDNTPQSDQDIIERYGVEQELPRTWMKLVANVVFFKLSKLIAVLAVTGFFIGCYYKDHCDMKDGHLVSKTMYAPKSMAFSVFNAFLPEMFPLEREDTPYWTMPTDD